MVNMLSGPSLFKGSHPKDKQVIKNDYNEAFEEFSDEELKMINTEPFEKIFDEEFAGINTNIYCTPEIGYINSRSGTIHDVCMSYALPCGEYTGEYLPWGLKAISNAIKFTEETNIKVSGTTINLQKTISSFFGRDISFIQQACDKILDAIEPFCKEMKVYCSDRIVDAEYKQGKCIPQKYDNECGEIITDKEIAEVRAEPDTNIENINPIQPGNSPRCVF